MFWSPLSVKSFAVRNRTPSLPSLFLKTCLNIFTGNSRATLIKSGVRQGCIFCRESAGWEAENARYRPFYGITQSPLPFLCTRCIPLPGIVAHFPLHTAAGRSYGFNNHAHFNTFALANSIYSRAVFFASPRYTAFRYPNSVSRYTKYALLYCSPSASYTLGTVSKDRQGGRKEV